jgi:hypothetical protein
MHSPKWTVIAALVALVVATTPLAAQRIAPSGATNHSTAATTEARPDTVTAAEGSRVVSGAKGALIGAGIGAAGGLLLGVIATSDARDHSEDALAYMVLGTLGAFVGLIGGAIIGAVTAH